MSLDINALNLEDYPLFHGISEEVAREFLNAGFHFHYEAGTPLISNNDLGETFYLILRGMAKLVLANQQKEEININLFRTGDFFGELSMLEPKSIRSGNIISITDIEVVTVHKKEFLRMMQQHPGLALNLARVLGQRLRAMNERMLTERLPSDMHRVAHTLLLLAKKGKMFNEEGTILMPPLALKEWIMFCYTSSEGFMASMEELKRAGVVEWQNQRIAITNIEKLRHYADVHQQRIVETIGLPSVQAPGTPSA